MKKYFSVKKTCPACKRVIHITTDSTMRNHNGADGRLCIQSGHSYRARVVIISTKERTQ